MESAGQDEESSGNAALDKRLATGVLKGDTGTETAQVWISAFLIAALGFIVYLGSFSIPFQGDDLELFHESQSLHRVVTSTGALEQLPTSPLSVVGLAMGYAVTGGNVDGLHGLSILLHLCCAILVFLLARRMLPAGTPEAVAMVAGMFFVAHPLLTGTVNYLVAFPVLQSTFFGLLALNLLLRGAAQANFCLASLAGAVVAFVLAFGSDTTALLLPVVGIALLQMRSPGSGSQAYLRVSTSAMVLTTVALWVVGEASGLFAPAVISHGMGARLDAFLDLSGNLLLSTLWPLRSSVLPLAPGLIAGIAGLLLLIVALGFGLLGRQWAVVHAIALALLGLFSAACYAPAEVVETTRYLYLPFAGLAILLPWILVRIQAPSAFRVASGVVAVLILALGFLAFQRTEAWKQPEVLWGEELERHPESVEPLQALGRFQSAAAELAPLDNLQVREKLFTAASNTWKTVLERIPGDPEAEKNLGIMAVNLGKFDEARPLLETASTRLPEDQELALYLGYSLEQVGRNSGERDLLIGALRAFRRAARLGALPVDAQARYGMLAASFGEFETGLPLVKAAMGDDAESPLKAPFDQFTKMAEQVQTMRQRVDTAVSQNPAGIEGLLARVDLLLAEGHLMSAFYLLQVVMEQAPSSDAAWATLGMVSARIKGSENFLAEWGASRAGNATAWEQLSGRCAVTGAWEAAELYLRHGLSGTPGAMPELRLAEVAIQVKQPQRAVAYFEAAQKAYPDSPLPWLQMADMNIVAEDFARARGQLDEAEKRGATPEEIKARRDKLGAGQGSVPTGIQRTVIQ
ncbi:MAG: tetratricopeptide repeat protein [Candidatus Hydrogenedentes bacterium]|nr:tetratricopeptide repeat protein [Candidatus Hydrogenedentota bacterium]